MFILPAAEANIAFIWEAPKDEAKFADLFPKTLTFPFSWTSTAPRLFLFNINVESFTYPASLKRGLFVYFIEYWASPLKIL